MITEQILKDKLSNYINEELTSNDMKEIRKLIRIEIAEVMFDLFKKRGVWI